MSQDTGIRVLQLIDGHDDGHRPRITVCLRGPDGSARQMVWALDSLTWQGIHPWLRDKSKSCRLSLRAYRDPHTDGLYSTLSIVDRGSVRQITFPCSRQYAENLNWIQAGGADSRLGGTNAEAQPAGVAAAVATATAEATPMSIAAAITARAPAATRATATRSRAAAAARNRGRKRKTGPLRWLLLSLVAAGVVSLAAQWLGARGSVEGIGTGSASGNDASALRMEALPDGESASPAPADNAREASPPPWDEAQASDAGVSMLPAPGENVYRLPSGQVALTFDDGPSKYTEEIVDILTEHGVKATFFFIGANLSSHPDAVRYAYDRGMAIGNHSWSHSRLPSLSRVKMEEEISRTNKELENLIGEPVRLFRPPFGATGSAVERTLSREGMLNVLWNRDPEDWRVSEAEDILRYIRSTEPDGGIYLLHESDKTIEVLPQIIQFLQSFDDLELMAIGAGQPPAPR